MISKATTISSKLKPNLWLVLSLAIIIYLVTRLINLDSIPVFADEAIYIRWSQIIKSVETLRFIPLTDGKQPLFMWLTVPLLKFISDPLIAGRLVSVFSGLATLLCLFLISLHLRLSVLGHIMVLSLYLFSPFTFFFDRMALADNLLTFWGVLALYLSLLQAKYLRLDLSLILGGILAAAWITKSPAMIFVICSFFTCFFLQPKIKTALLSGLSCFIGFAGYNLLRLGPQFHMIALRNRDYVWSVSDIFQHPFDPLKPHIQDVLRILPAYLPGILAIVIILIVIYIQKKKYISFNYRYLIVFFSWFFLPLVFNLMFSKVFTSRYILYTIPPLILTVSYILNSFSFSAIYTGIYFLGIFFGLITIVKLSFTPYQTTLPSTESGYLNDWTSGWGIKPAATYLINRSRYANVIVGTEGYFGTLPDGLQIYTNNIPHLTVFGVGVNLEKIPEKLIDAKNHGDEVYLLINRQRLFFEPPAEQILFSFIKPDHTSLLLIKI